MKEKMPKIEIKGTELAWLDKYDEEGKLRSVEKVQLPFQKVEVVNAPRIGKKGKEGKLTLYDFYEAKEGDTFEEGWRNKLIWGDNKLVMSSLLKDFAGKINLIYIDPPFATGADFKSTIQVGEGGELEFQKEHSIIEEKAYRDTWGKGVDSYLNMMYERLILMKDLLAESGIIFVHLDWHVGHHIKVMMNEIFGNENSLDEVIWHYGTPSGGRAAGNKPIKSHDIILIYAKEYGKHIYNKLFLPYSGKYIKERFIYTDADGRIYRTRKRAGGRIDKQYLDESPGVPLGSVWSDIKQTYSMHLVERAKEETGFFTQKPEALLDRIIRMSSNPGDIVADFFCGSGTTLTVAEKLRRRWIGCDISRYAIHLTKKRLLEIENSKDLLDETGKKKYGKKANPFEILNLGKYERQIWQGITFNNQAKQTLIPEYLAFILKLYGAEPISGFYHIHGKIGNTLVRIGAVDAPVTIQDVIDAINECKIAEQKELHILGWEWEMGLNDVVREIAERQKINLKLRTIPSEVTDKQAVERGDIRFFELAYFKADPKIKGRTLSVELKDFVIPHTELIPDEAKDKIKKWSDWIDYWAVDFNFQNDTFNNQWISYRTKKDQCLQLKSAPHTYDKPGKYKIFVKVIDIFGIDTSQIFEVGIE